MDINDFDLSKMTLDEKLELIDLLEKREEYIKYHKVDQFQPYPFQLNFYEAGKHYKRRFLCAANR